MIVDDNFFIVILKGAPHNRLIASSEFLYCVSILCTNSSMDKNCKVKKVVEMKT